MGRPRPVWLALILSVCLAACGGARPAWYPARSCAEAWRDLPARDRGYDYARDATATPDGNQGYAGYAARTDRARCHKRWTVLLYMAADNDLSPYAFRNLREIEAADAGPASPSPTASSDALDVVVQLDDAGDDGRRRLHLWQAPAGPEPPDPAEVRAARAGLRSPVVARLQENGPDVAADLYDFLRWGVRGYPSERYLVVVWGHGEGWAGPRVLDPSVETPFGGLALDEHPRTRLTTVGLADALQRTAADLWRPIDVYAADACLMQSVEVAAALAPSTRYIVGSPQVEPFYGLPYRDLLQAMNADAAVLDREARSAAVLDREARSAAVLDDARRVARLMVGTFQRSFLPGGARARVSKEAAATFALSALDSAALTRRLVPALTDVGRALDQYLVRGPEPPIAGLDTPALRSGDLRFVVSGDPELVRFRGGVADVGSLVDAARGALGSLPGGVPVSVAAALGRTQAALSAAVVETAAAPEYRARRPGFRGVSVWLPPTGADRASRLLDYEGATLWDNRSPWRDWQARLDQLNPTTSTP